jgi:hypothetical protein
MLYELASGTAAHETRSFDPAVGVSGNGAGGLAEMETLIGAPGMGQGTVPWLGFRR